MLIYSSIPEFLRETAAKAPRQNKWFSGHEDKVSPHDFESFCKDIAWVVEAALKILKSKAGITPDSTFINETNIRDSTFGVDFEADEKDILVKIDRRFFERSAWRAYCNPEFEQGHQIVDKKTGQPTTFKDTAKMFLLRDLVMEIKEKGLLNEKDADHAFEDAYYEILGIVSAPDLDEFRFQTRHNSLKMHRWRKDYADLLKPNEFADYSYDLYWGFHYALNSTGMLQTKDIRVILMTNEMLVERPIEGPFDIKQNENGGLEILLNPFTYLEFEGNYSSVKPYVAAIQSESGIHPVSATNREYVKIDTAIETAAQLYDLGLITYAQGSAVQATLIEDAAVSTLYSKAPYAN